jgi:hypothetical protein
MHLRGWVDHVLNGDGPDRELEALFLACCWLRGCDARNSRLSLWAADAYEWILRHGVPTREKLLTWIDELGIEAEIPAPLVRLNLQGSDPCRPTSPQHPSRSLPWGDTHRPEKAGEFPGKP